MEISASILACDPLYLGDALHQLEDAGVDSIHIDIMDGRYAENFTFGLHTVSCISKTVRISRDVHLQILEPELYVKNFYDAGASMLTIHPETCRYPIRLLRKIKDYGMKAGIAINPHIPIYNIRHLTDYIDAILIMLAEPGFGGQESLEFTIGKVSEAKAFVSELDKRIKLSVDGGITLANAKQLVEAGADVFNIGTALVSCGSIRDNVNKFRSLARK
jgi:ribulose-phosphate 3-epimerase